jgi:hypothetical protein
MKKIKWFIKDKFGMLPDYFNGEGNRPHYGFIMMKAAELAKNLGYSRVTIIEFGVANGAGLVSIEKNIKLIKKKIDIDFDVLGFDSSIGLPKPKDYRDEPFKWQEGFYKMDKVSVEKKLEISKLVIGDVSKTVKNESLFKKDSPIGCIMFDLDLYSSTKSALKVFSLDHDLLLPRVNCYFDDIGSIEFIGERLAIEEFNQINKNMKIGQNYKLLFNSKCRGNYIYEMHNFNHPHYSKHSDLNKSSLL